VVGEERGDHEVVGEERGDHAVARCTSEHYRATAWWVRSMKMVTDSAVTLCSLTFFSSSVPEQSLIYI
jgi:hypothetical protein